MFVSMLVDLCTFPARDETAITKRAGTSTIRRPPLSTAPRPLGVEGPDDDTRDLRITAGEFLHRHDNVIIPRVAGGGSC